MILEVGKPYAPLAGRGEGVLFDIDDAGAKLFYCFNRPTAEEIAATKAGQLFQMKFLELGGILWILTKCGSLEWTDAPYNPRTSIFSYLEHPHDGKGLALTLAMADALTAEVKSVRLIGLGEEFSATLVEAAGRLRSTPMSFTETQRFINNAMMKYTTRDLVKMAPHSFESSEGI